VRAARRSIRLWRRAKAPRSCRRAPGTPYDAAAAGTGKTLLAQCVEAMCGMDREVIPEYGGDEKELRKRLLSVLPGGHAYVRDLHRSRPGRLAHAEPAGVD
jgi:hypothetical protein